MSAIDPMWTYILVPAALVSILILIRLRQEKTDKQAENALVESEQDERVQLGRNEVAEERFAEVKETRRNPESPSETKPENCLNFLGYLYLKKAPDRTHIPSECYNCPKILQCLYSPNVIEKVYGE